MVWITVYASGTCRTQLEKFPTYCAVECLITPQICVGRLPNVRSFDFGVFRSFNPFLVQLHKLAAVWSLVRQALRCEALRFAQVWSISFSVRRFSDLA